MDLSTSTGSVLSQTFLAGEIMLMPALKRGLAMLILHGQTQRRVEVTHVNQLVYIVDLIKPFRGFKKPLIKSLFDA